MLQHLHLRNFTVFENAEFEFGPGLNVLVGTNGTGKSHVLKVGYSVLRSLTSRLQNWDGFSFDSPLTSLVRIFRPVPENPDELIRREATPKQAFIWYELDDERLSRGQILLSPDISVESKFAPMDSKAAKEISAANDSPVFIPAKEVLTMAWLFPLYGLREFSVDETYPRILQLLAVPSLKSPLPETQNVLNFLVQLIGGKIDEEDNRYYLILPEQPRMELNLVAEGYRKFAILYRLLANGALTSKTTLFWDEPEANLNPALLKEMAVVLTELAKAGFQIIIATHSLFLLKELHILAQQEGNKPVQYFGLSAQPGGATTVATANNLELLPDIAALDAELAQSDRLQRLFDQEDVNRR